MGLQRPGPARPWGVQPSPSSYPGRAYRLPVATAISGGADSSLAVAYDGHLWSWGNPDDGRLDRSGESALPGRATSITITVSGLAAGSAAGYELDTKGKVWASGYSGLGVLGAADALNANGPFRVTTLPQITQISTGTAHAAALTTDGRVLSWGTDEHGQLGDGTSGWDQYGDPLISAQPVFARGLGTVTQVSAGSNSTAVIDTHGRVWTWGRVLAQLSWNSTYSTAPQLVTFG